MGWYNNSPYGRKLHLHGKELSGKQGALHESREGMLGYITKDMGEYSRWMCMLHDKVSDEDLEYGARLYATYGAPDKKRTVQLTRNNLMDRAYCFWKVHKRRGNLDSWARL